MIKEVEYRYQDPRISYPRTLENIEVGESRSIKLDSPSKCTLVYQARRELRRKGMDFRFTKIIDNVYQITRLQ